MWVEETKAGKFKFTERYKDYLTGKLKKVSITLDKNTAQTRKQAQKLLYQKIDEASTEVKTKNLTLEELIEEYRKDQEISVKKSTYMRNYHACNTIMSILGKNTIVEKMTARYVRSKFLATGKEPGTLNEHLTRFKALIRWGFRNDLLPNASFLEKIESFKDIPHKMKIQDKYLESDELRALLQGMQHPVWRLLTEFMALSGLRCGEAIALKASDVDIAHSVIHVTKTYDSNNEVITSAKSLCSIRDVFIQDELKTVCKSIREEMLKRRLQNNISKPEWFIFSTDGSNIKYFAYNKYLKENSLAILGRPITPHALRHTHASLLLENGISIDTISRRLGHENSRITKEIYLHVTKKLEGKDNLQISKIHIL